jgi:hypothetical protein
MSQQPVDVPRFVQIIARYRTLVGFMAVLGLLGGLVFAALNPPGSASEALVVFTPPSCSQGAMCGGPMFSPGYAEAGVLRAFPSGVQIRPLTTSVLSVSATGGTAAQAAATADAAARSYVAYARSSSYMGEHPSAQILQSATAATGTTPAKRLLDDALLGAVFGALAGILAALAGGQNTTDPPTGPSGIDIGDGVRGTGQATRYASTGLSLGQISLAYLGALDDASGGDGGPRS